ncbi:MAG TPA: hypothetical protein VKA46_07795 [Gemmataceae bacterium]|nr:hypothetical protein [Gemmataceae bacterium]
MVPHVLEAPFSDRTQSLTVLGTALKVLPLEPVVWISLTSPEVTALPEDAPRFPAVVDTGHASSLSIKQEHLGKLVDEAALPILGRPAALVYADGRRASLPRYQARVWLHGFHPDPTRQPRPLRLPTRDGIICYRTANRPREREESGWDWLWRLLGRAPPASQTSAAVAPGPHLPLLGARAFRPLGLTVQVDYSKLTLSIARPDPQTPGTPGSAIAQD